MKKLFIVAVVLTASLATFAQKAKANSVENKKGSVIATAYSCPMHPEVTSDKPGKCSKCGMNLTLSKKEQMKAEAVKIYSCPMHPEVTSNKPGKCSKCGMNLTTSKKEQMKMEVMKTFTCPIHNDVTSAKKGKCPKCGMDLTEVKAKSKVKKS